MSAYDTILRTWKQWILDGDSQVEARYMLVSITACALALFGAVNTALPLGWFLLRFRHVYLNGIHSHPWSDLFFILGLIDIIGFGFWYFAIFFISPQILFELKTPGFWANLLCGWVITGCSIFFGFKGFYISLVISLALYTGGLLGDTIEKGLKRE
jgi:hypothetical protein